MTAEIPKADAYGGVLANTHRMVLLLQYKGNFGDYIWTFAAGIRNKGEKPDQAALRIVHERTGYRASIIAPIPVVFEALFDETVRKAFYLMEPIGHQGKFKEETAATKWVDLRDAADLISQTKTKFGRERDLAVLIAAIGAFDALSYADRPGTCKEDWNTLPMPIRRKKIALNLRYSQGAMSRIRKGFCPWEMNQHWFAWFEESVLYLHRSWTGFCIYEVNFVFDGEGWRANSAIVNRDSKQWSSKYEGYRKEIERLIEVLLVNGPTEPRLDRMLVGEASPAWPWDVGLDLWKEGFSHLKQFSERNGHCLVPVDYKTDGGYQLGEWVGEQRQKRDKMDPDRRRRLEALPGWVWEIIK